MNNNLISKTITECAKYYDISKVKLLGKCRNSKVIKARQMTMYVLNVCLDCSFSEISTWFNRGIATVAHNISAIDQDISVNANQKNDFINIRTIINVHINNA